jgi:hypothetical protein
MRLQRALGDNKYDMGGVLSGWMMGSKLYFRRLLLSVEIAME